jgi:Tol biopolymer transport system component
MTTKHTTTKTHYFLRVLAALMALAIAMSALVEGAGPAKAAFPGQNGRIAFTSLRDGNYEIYSMKADGTEQTNLTRNSVDDMHPAVSPDGKKIAYSSFRNGNGEVYESSYLGLTQTNLTKSATYETEPSYSPNGKKLSFTSDRLGNDNIFKMNTDGSSPERLTRNQASDFDSDWGKALP